MKTNRLIFQLLGSITEFLLDDETWKLFGYKKRPKRGAIFSRLFPKKYELDNFIFRHFFILGVIDVLNGIKKSKQSYYNKTIVILNFFEEVDVLSKNTDCLTDLLKDLPTAYDIYKESNPKNLYEPYLSKSENVLGSTNSARFLIGISKIQFERMLMDISAKDFFLSSDRVAELINTQDIAAVKEDLTGFSKETLEEYGKFISKLISEI